VKALVSRLVAVPELTAAEVAAMYALFDQSFLAAADVFERDLRRKDWAILFNDAAAGELQGFTSLALYRSTARGEPLSVAYSGDTLIRPACWGTPELPRRWIQSVLALAAGMPQPLYWLLLTSGFRTYRFLPVFFQEFYPRHDRPTPAAEQALLDELAGERFGDDFDPARGVVRFAQGATPLRPGLAAASPERRRDPHVEFSLARNPGHAQGDELVCITRLHPDNLTAAGRRMNR
jgi:hypothetical protein